MRRLSLRPGEAVVLAQALALWTADACVYTFQEVREAEGARGKGRKGEKHHLASFVVFLFLPLCVTKTNDKLKIVAGVLAHYK